MVWILIAAAGRSITEIPLPVNDLTDAGQVTAVGEMNNVVVTLTCICKPRIHRALGHDTKTGNQQ